MTESGIKGPHNNINQDALGRQLMARFIPTSQKTRIDIRPLVESAKIDPGLFARENIGAISSAPINPKVTTAVSASREYSLPPISMDIIRRFLPDRRIDIPQVYRAPVLDIVSAHNNKVGINDYFALVDHYLQQGRVCLFGDIHNSQLPSSLFLDTVETMADAGYRFAVGLELPSHSGLTSYEKIEEVIPSLRYRYPKIARPFMEEVVRLCREYDLPIVPLDSPRNVVVGSERPSVSLTSGWVRDDWMAQQIIDFQHYDYFNQHYSSLFVEKPSYTGVLGFLGANHIKSTGIPARIPDTVTFIPELDNPIFSCLKSLMCRATGRVTPYYNYLITP